MSALNPEQVILVIDNDDVTRQLLSVLLADSGKVVCATSGEEALEKITDISPDLIILDVEMPEMDGYAVCARLKADENTSGIPVVFLTANESSEEEERGLDVGAIDFIRKPISTGIVRIRTSNILNLLAATRKLEHLASTDSLTGAFNRRHFLEAGSAELHRSKRYEHPFSFMMLDIDHFKQVNDIHGHSIGDEALKETVAVIQNILRDEDTLGRLGGEEFAIMLLQTDSGSAVLVAERIRESISRISIDTPTEPLSFTISIGVSEVLGEDADIEEALSRADAFLYQAKEQGRDRVIAA